MPKGKKLCPECGIANGVRTSICGCGHRFSSKKEDVASSKKEEVKANTHADLKSDTTCEVDVLKRPLPSSRFFSSISCPLIQTPAGRCPVKPKGFSNKEWADGQASNEVIEEWALKAFSTGNYLPDAVVYWMHEFWNMNSNHGLEYNRVKEIVLKTLCGDSKRDSL